MPHQIESCQSSDAPKLFCMGKQQFRNYVAVCRRKAHIIAGVACGLAGQDAAGSRARRSAGGPRRGAGAEHMEDVSKHAQASRADSQATITASRGSVCAHTNA